MSPTRLRTLTATTALSAALLLAACGDRTPAPDSGATPQGQDPGDSTTEPSAAPVAADEASAQPADAAPESTGAASSARTEENGGMAMLNQVAGLGGAMHAAVELCDPGIAPAQLADARQRQQQEFVRLGGDVAVFEREFSSAHAAVRAQHASATPAQQAQMCAELEAMATQAPTPPQN